LPAKPEELQQRDGGDDRNVMHIDTPLMNPILLLTTIGPRLEPNED
jgi:hypothetical protein